MEPSWEPVSLKEYFQSIPFFQYITENQLEALLSESLERTFSQNEIITQQGNKAEYIYVIIRGGITEQVEYSYPSYNSRAGAGTICTLHQIVLNSTSYLSSKATLFNIVTTINSDHCELPSDSSPVPFGLIQKAPPFNLRPGTLHLEGVSVHLPKDLHPGIRRTSVIVPGCYARTQRAIPLSKVLPSSDHRLHFRRDLPPRRRQSLQSLQNATTYRKCLRSKQRTVAIRCCQHSKYGRRLLFQDLLYSAAAYSESTVFIGCHE